MIGSVHQFVARSITFQKQSMNPAKRWAFDGGLRIRFRSPPRDDMILTRHRLMDYP